METSSSNEPIKVKSKYPKSGYTFDYEINSVKIDDNEDLNCKMQYYDKEKQAYSNMIYNIN